ncbi:MAG: hypothetical protein HQ546_02985 [Planctomycetes bacterium]|nr:hypothetical protein [Planctomycetota bacterium]
MGLGRGPGIGPRPTADDGLVGFQGTRVKSNTDPAYPPIATWAFAGEQVRGEARQQLREAALAARDGFAEAVSSEKVPKKYEGPVKAYFSRLAESGQD